MQIECIYQLKKKSPYSCKMFFCFKIHRAFLTHPIFLTHLCDGVLVATLCAQSSVMPCLAWHSLHQLCSNDGAGLYHSLAHLSLVQQWDAAAYFLIKSPKRRVWNSEILTALEHVNGAGNVCELWTVARKMFIQNFATLKSKWVGN